MKKLIAAILLTIVLAPSGIKLAIVLDYAARYEYYANVLCVNKQKKEMHCKGACQVKKNLAAVDKTSKETPILPSLLKEKTELICIGTDFINPAIFIAPIEKSADQFLKEKYSAHHLTVPTPPPSLI